MSRHLHHRRRASTFSKSIRRLECKSPSAPLSEDAAYYTYACATTTHAIKLHTDYRHQHSTPTN
eukprot:1590160-Pleurochrysis_carterae.AAC.1